MYLLYPLFKECINNPYTFCIQISLLEIVKNNQFNRIKSFKSDAHFTCKHLFVVKKYIIVPVKSIKRHHCNRRSKLPRPKAVALLTLERGKQRGHTCATSSRPAPRPEAVVLFVKPDRVLLRSCSEAGNGEKVNIF
jgi:hypothetical protein